MNKNIVDPFDELFDEPYVKPQLTPEQKRERLAEVNRDAQEEYERVWAPYDRQIIREMREAEISFARFKEECCKETMNQHHPPIWGFFFLRRVPGTSFPARRFARSVTRFAPPHFARIFVRRINLEEVSI